METTRHTRHTAARLLALSAVVGALLPAAPAAAQQLTPFRIGSQSPPIFEYVYINYAIDGGFLKKQGLDAKFIGFAAGLTSTQALAGNSVDVACDGFTPTVSAISRGSSARIIYAVNSDNTYVVIARDSINKVEDLRGKKWAITEMGAISQTYASLWLSKNGMPEGSVDWIPIGGTSARARAVLANQVDVTLVTVGEWLRVRDQKGVTLLATLSDTLPPLPLNTCAVSAKMLAEKPQAVQGLVNGILDAVRAARTPEGRAQYIKSAREIDPSSYTEKQYDELYEYYFGTKGNPLAVDPNGGLYPEVYVANMKTMVAEKTIDAVVPLDKLWVPQFVNNYLGEHGWYDTLTRKDGLYLRDMVKR